MTKRTCIMVVDDDRETRRMLGRTFELEGFDVIAAGDGNSALNLLEERRPDLAVLDIIMPGLDGYQVIEAIRKHHNIPIVMLTAKSEIASLKKALNLGADDYLTKPCNTKILLARIRAKLRRASDLPPHPPRLYPG